MESTIFSESPKHLSTKSWLFSFKGRLNRKQLWFFYGPYMVLSVSTAIVSFWAQVILTLALLWPLMAVQAKRWHDLGLSGWWSIGWFLPIVGWLFTLLDCGVYKGGKLKNEYGRSLYRKE